jgi:CPA2 family monovalent cation:H+ antiporter-2
MSEAFVIFRDLTYVFLAAVTGGLLAWRLRLPVILGFVLGGIAISPFTPGPHLADAHSFEALADVGVVLLMFSIGVEFSFRDLARVKKVALIGGTIGILCMLGLAVCVARISGWTITQGVIIGATISVTSTMVLARLLRDSGKLGTEHGRVMIGITLVDDLAVVCMTAVLPVFNGSGDYVAKAAWTLGRALILLIPLIFLAITVIPRLLRKVRETKSTELILLVAIAISFGTAALAQAAGLSIALGAFLAGLSISGSEDLHEAHAQLVPLRDAFVALFFVSLGTLIDPRALLASLPLLGTMLGLIILGKFVVWSVVVRLFRYPLVTAIAVAAGLTQIGELSFVLAKAAWSAGLIREQVFTATVAASLVSIAVNVFVFRTALGWMDRRVPAPREVTAQVVG